MPWDVLLGADNFFFYFVFIYLFNVCECSIACIPLETELGASDRAVSAHNHWANEVRFYKQVKVKVNIGIYVG